MDCVDKYYAPPTFYKTKLNTNRTVDKWSLTRDDDGLAGIDDAAVRPYTVPAWCCRLHFETHSSVRMVHQFEVSGDYICERTWRTESNKHQSVISFGAQPSHTLPKIRYTKQQRMDTSGSIFTVKGLRRATGLRWVFWLVLKKELKEISRKITEGQLN